MKFAAGLLVLVAANATAQTIPMNDYCSMNSTEKAIADATALILQGVTYNGDGTYKVPHQTNAQTWPPVTSPYCPSVPFLDQERATGGRTAFLVGDRLMVTAPHTQREYSSPTNPGFDPKNYTVVFGLHANLVNGVCMQPDFDRIPAANVYRPPADSYLYSSLIPPSALGKEDYLLFMLERSVPGVRPLPLRRSGQPDLGDPLSIVGFPNRLPIKVSRGGYVRGLYAGGVDPGPATTWLGSSGSPIFNGRTNLVESIVAIDSMRGTWLFAEQNGCFLLKIDSISPENPTNGSILNFSSHVPIPPTELQLSPLETVLHRGPVGGPLTNGLTQFTVSAPPTATSNLAFNIGLPLLIPPAPGLNVSPGPGTYAASANGTPLQFTVTADNGALTSCKTVDTAVSVVPASGGFTSWIRHRFEVGMANFSIAPESAWNVSELGAPYPTRTITVTNTYTLPGQFTVAPSVPWIRVNGAPSQTLNLAPGANASVTLSFDDNQSGFPLSSETKTATVTIQPTQPQCNLRSPAVINVSLTHGIEEFTGLNTSTYNSLPPPADGLTFGVPVDIFLDVEEDAFQVEDIDLIVGFNNLYQYYWAHEADTLVRIELIAPDGTAATLWDRNDGTSAYFGTEPIANMSALILDQTTSPPLGPDPLSRFIGHEGSGRWTVRLRTTDSTNRIQPFLASLKIAKKAHADFYSYNYQYDYLPPPAAGQTFGPAADFYVDLSGDAAFSVHDIDFAIGFYNVLPFLDAGQADQLVQIQLLAPDGMIATLWDRNNAPAGYLGVEHVDWLGGTTVSTLKLDDQATPPLGPNLLGTFDGHPGNGIWTIRLRTSSSSQNILISHLKLAIGR